MAENVEKKVFWPAFGSVEYPNASQNKHQQTDRVTNLYKVWVFLSLDEISYLPTCFAHRGIDKILYDMSCLGMSII